MRALYPPYIFPPLAIISFCNATCLIFVFHLSSGAVPAALGAYYRAKLPETPRFTAHVIGDAEKARRDMNHVLNDNERQDGADQFAAETKAYPVVLLFFLKILFYYIFTCNSLILEEISQTSQTSLSTTENGKI